MKGRKYKMKFKITKTTLWNDEEVPCEKAIKEKYAEIEVRTLHTFEEFDKKFGKSEDEWLSKGINHCVNKKGYIQREIPNGCEGWFIEINSLEELMEFNKRYGNIIIQKCWDNPNITEIEIYNGYRE